MLVWSFLELQGALPPVPPSGTWPLYPIFSGICDKLLQCQILQKILSSYLMLLDTKRYFWCSGDPLKTTHTKILKSRDHPGTVPSCYGGHWPQQ